MKITLIGCGTMGLIYARAFIKYSIVEPENLLLVEKSQERVAELMKLGFGRVVTPEDDLILESDLILLAVKPQDYAVLSGSLKGRLKSHNVVLSIMAGIPISYIEESLDHPIVVRAMPNAPASMGMGVTALFSNKAVSNDQLRKAEHVLATTGRTVYVEEESQMDSVTALSGSGPAYFYYFVKHMIDAGKSMGLNEGVSSMLVKQTMLGAFHMMNHADGSLDDLIKAVASKGGTTEAALSVLTTEHVGKNIEQAILAAEHRARELSK